MEIRTSQNTNPTVQAYTDRTANAAVGSEKPAAPPVQAVAAIQQPSPADMTAQVTQAIKSINKAMEANAQGLVFSIDESDHSIVKVVDQETGDVIRQLPSKEALEISQALEKAQGLLIKQKA